MIGKALTVASVLTATQAAKQYVATFSGDNDITGTVTIDNGYVGVNIDLSEMPDLTGGFENCTEGGMSYHIHELWDFNDTRTESMECGSDYTGGHWDPWNGMCSAPLCFPHIACTANPVPHSVRRGVRKCLLRRRRRQQ